MHGASQTIAPRNRSQPPPRTVERMLSQIIVIGIFCETAPIVQEVFSGFLLVFFCAVAFMRADQ